MSRPDTPSVIAARPGRCARCRLPYRRRERIFRLPEGWCCGSCRKLSTTVGGVVVPVLGSWDRPARRGP